MALPALGSMLKTIKPFRFCCFFFAYENQMAMHHITTRTIADVHGRRGGLPYYVWRGGLLYYVYYATRLRGGGGMFQLSAASSFALSASVVVAGCSFSRISALDFHGRGPKISSTSLAKITSFSQRRSARR